MFRTFLVKREERALLFRRSGLVAVLHPGEHRYFDPLKQFAVETYAPATAALDHRLADRLVQVDPVLVEREFHDVRLGATEVGLRYENGALVEVLAPNARRLYFRDRGVVRIARFDIAQQFTLPYSLTLQLGSATRRAKVIGVEHVLAVQVPQHHVALLFVDGNAPIALQPGLHAFFRFHRKLRAELVGVLQTDAVVNVG